MAKLTGRAKAAFLRMMKRGREAAKRRRKAKANPQLLVIHPNPKSGAALAAYRQFHGVEPVKVKRIGRGKNPKRMVSLGQVVEVVYEPRRGQRRRVHWFHRFKGRAVLLASPDGRELRILDPDGAVLVDFDRGIVG